MIKSKTSTAHVEFDSLNDNEFVGKKTDEEMERCQIETNLQWIFDELHSVSFYPEDHPALRERANITQGELDAYNAEIAAIERMPVGVFLRLLPYAKINSTQKDKNRFYVCLERKRKPNPDKTKPTVQP